MQVNTDGGLAKRTTNENKRISPMCQQQANSRETAASCGLPDCMHKAWSDTFFFIL